MFVTLLLLHLVPVWAFRYLPIQDGPNHLYCAGVLLHYNDPGNDLYRRFYEINARPNPNWLSHLALAGMLTVFPPLVAEKILVSLYLLLLPLGMRYALRAIRPGSEPLAVLAFPLLYNWPLQAGFYNYVLSMALLLFALGYWIRHQEAPRPRHAAGLAVLMLLVYFFHLISLAMFLVACAVLTAWLGLFEWQSGWRATWRRLAFTAPAALVFLVLSLAFVRREGGATGPLDWSRLVLFFPGKLFPLLSLDTFMVSYRIEEMIPAILLALTFLVPAVRLSFQRLRRRRLERWDGLALLALAWAGAYLLAPSTYGDAAYIYPRMAGYFYFALLLWLGSAGLSARLMRLLRLTGGGMALVFLFFYSMVYAQAQGMIKECVTAAPAVRPGSVILFICMSPWGVHPDGGPWSVAVEPFRHIGGWVALERGCVNLGDYEARTTHAPTRFREAVNPQIHMGPVGPVPALKWLDLEAYERKTGVKLDAVLVWDDRLGWEAEDMTRVRKQVERMFPVRTVTQPRGLMVVYRR